MSILAFEHKSLPFSWHLPEFLNRLFAAKVEQGRLYTEMKDLPDYLLLDIGIDPRNIPQSLDEAIARQDFAHGGVVSAHHRTIAKS